VYGIQTFYDTVKWRALLNTLPSRSVKRGESLDQLSNYKLLRMAPYPGQFYQYHIKLDTAIVKVKNYFTDQSSRTCTILKATPLALLPPARKQLNFASRRGS